jgi:hypothetical protein
MSLIETARKTLIGLPISDVLRERLSLALDESAQLQTKCEETKSQLARVEIQLEIERSNHKKTQDELVQLKNEHAEEIRIQNGIEFRRGKRTGGKWTAFCPKCHMPVQGDEDYAIACSANCGWSSVNVFQSDLGGIISQLA